MTRGRPFQRGNKFGRGRPKGTPNKKTALAQKLFQEHSPNIMALAISRCRDDPQMLRMLASQLVPKRRGSPVNIGRLELTTLEDLNRASATVFEKASSGKIGMSEALDFCTMIEGRRRVLETQDLERRLSALENPAPPPRQDATRASIDPPSTKS